MKLILAIVNNEDSALASAALTEAGFTVTRLSTTGGFLMVGNTTFLIGTEDEDTERAIDILKKHCKKKINVLSYIMISSIFNKKTSYPYILRIQRGFGVGSAGIVQYATRQQFLKGLTVRIYGIPSLQKQNMACYADDAWCRNGIYRRGFQE